MTEYTPQQSTQEIKLCECGCGQPAPIAKKTCTRQGHIKGQPQRFIYNHHGRQPLEIRFWKYVSPGPFTECWLWQGAVDACGYGRLLINRRNTSAHRVSWEIHNGPIPDGLWVLHNCPDGDNPRCVNPYHLFLGTHADNMLDMVKKKRQAMHIGESNGRAIIREEDVALMRRLFAQGVSRKELEERFPVKQSQVRNIIKHEAWVHIP